MERRATERFYIDLPADACPAERPGAGEQPARVQIRDISSAGAAFYDSSAWKVGEKIFMDIHVGDGIVGPFSYSLKAAGTLVRKDFEEHHGTSVFAVAFDQGLKMSDWMEIEALANGGDEKGKNMHRENKQGD